MFSFFPHLLTPCEDKNKKTPLERGVKCRISVLRKAAGPSSVRKHGAPVDEGYTHAHLKPTKEGQSSPEPGHTHSQCTRAPHHRLSRSL